MKSKQGFIIFIKKLINVTADFSLLISVGAFIASYIEKTNPLIATSYILLGLTLSAVLQTVNKAWHDKEKGESNDRE